MNIKFFVEKFYGHTSLAHLPLKEESWENCIYNLYKMEVEKSGRSFICDDNVTATIRMLAEWIDGDYSSCIMTGAIGTGKTALLKSLMRLFDLLRNPITIPPLKCRSLVFYEATELCNKYVTFDDVRYEAFNCKALFIDDLGLESAQYYFYGNVFKPINEILLSRYASRLPTVITTNLSLEEFAGRYGNRLSDRVNELYATIEFPQKESYRRLLK